MKKLVLILGLIFFASNISFANNDGNHPKKDVLNVSADGVEVSVLTSVDQEQSNQDALYCHRRCKSGNSYSCWVCSCKNLPTCEGDTPK